MGTYHTVAQGEYLSSIAAQFGFMDYTVLWNHPNNAQLKNLRINPNVLYPGDILFVPEKQGKDESGATTKRHIFNLGKSPLALHLALKDLDQKPIANAACTLYLDQQKISLTSDENGIIQREIPAGARGCTLIVQKADTPYTGSNVQIGIGELDPVDTLTGQAGRLNNLGYFAGEPESSDDLDFASAVEEFQCNFGLKVDGDPGPQTQSKLKEVHGC
jgi:LysM repeat protein